MKILTNKKYNRMREIIANLILSKVELEIKFDKLYNLADNFTDKAILEAIQNAEYQLNIEHQTQIKL